MIGINNRHQLNPFNPIMSYPVTIEDYEELLFKQQEQIDYFQKAYYKETELNEKKTKSNINSIDRLNLLLRQKNDNIDKLQDKIEALESRLEHLQDKPKLQSKRQPKRQPKHEAKLHSIPEEIKMKKSIGKIKPYPTREPRYHMTEVARDWAS